MSHPINTEIEDNKIEMFHTALDEGDYLCAMAIVGDTKELGFDVLAAQMKKELLATPIEKFTNASPVRV